MKITIIVDNEANQGLKKEWGFACFIESAERILFDTGASAEVISHNAKELGIEAKAIDKLVISHDHWDHTGGLNWVLQNKGLKVYILESFSSQLKQELGGLEVVEVEELGEISRDVYSTGPIESADKYRLYEQALLLKTEKGIVIITGCAHPGLERIIERAKQLGKVRAVIGGFHGFNRLEALRGLEVIVPCHCTQYKEKIMQTFADKVKPCKAGLTLEFR
ncbi:MAG: MBL fold metallo-hydrolase [Candidatus Diapherotrites archaeon]|nr:MBL fold metallo-hydrolase [Candidatus Diapherotrites archaeon]